MKTVAQRGVDTAFQEKAVQAVTIVRSSNKKWYFTFEVLNPVTHEPETFSLRKQRGEIRTWSDPRFLFNYLHKSYGVIEGTFKIIEENKHETKAKRVRNRK